MVISKTKTRQSDYEKRTFIEEKNITLGVNCNMRNESKMLPKDCEDNLLFLPKICWCLFPGYQILLSVMNINASTLKTQITYAV